MMNIRNMFFSNDMDVMEFITKPAIKATLKVLIKQLEKTFKIRDDMELCFTVIENYNRCEDFGADLGGDYKVNKIEYKFSFPNNKLVLHLDNDVLELKVKDITINEDTIVMIDGLCTFVFYLKPKNMGFEDIGA